MSAKFVMYGAFRSVLVGLGFGFSKLRTIFADSAATVVDFENKEGSGEERHRPLCFVWYRRSVLLQLHFLFGMGGCVIACCVLDDFVAICDIRYIYGEARVSVWQPHDCVDDV